MHLCLVISKVYYYYMVVKAETLESTHGLWGLFYHSVVSYIDI